MDLFEILLTALGVSVDAFSVSVGGSLTCPRRKRLKNACLAAFFFGGFQFFMPLAGFFCAGFLTEAVSSAGNAVAFVLLLLVGGKMIYEGVKARNASPSAEIDGAFSSWKMLLVSSVATSIDAFAVGGGLAFAGKTFFLPCFAMGIVTGFASFTGVQLGARLGRLTRRPGRTLPEWLLLPAGGAAIIFVGIKLLFS
ncbi:MAG: manganese efflux pump [Lentisphaeria bacterium]|nr:manganese efflux pump [Lentisphaeria bacterium]